MESSQFDPTSRPDYRETAETLEQALSEACASPPAEEANTGELIKVEEMLALAGEAARRAISIRRKAKSQASPPDTVTEALGASPPVTPTHRLFDDARGVRWDVWAVYPEGRPFQLSTLPRSFQTGWLVFESTGEKRRLSPIPTDWQSLPTDELERLCERADIAPRRKRGEGGADESAPRGKD